MLKKSKNKRILRRPILKKVEAYSEILVLMNLENDAVVSDFVRLFPSAKLTVLVPRLQKERNDRIPYSTYHKSDFNLTGKLKNDNLAEVLSRTYELVVDLSSESKINDLLLNRIKGDFIIGGIASKNSHLYDLQIEQQLCDKHDIKALINHLTLLTQHGN
jgi:ADP-heptose:LPS heptosyltransferase